jgi:hypothetical protein
MAATSYGFIVHLKTYEDSTPWDTMVATGIEPTHYIKLYTSNLLKDKKLLDSEKRAMLDTIIDSVGVLDGERGEVNPLEILCVSVTPRYDLVIGFKSSATAQ